MSLTIRTNNVSRPVLYWHDLTATERADFDYLDTPERQDEASFARYRGVVYDLGDFAATRGHGAPEYFAKWHGYVADSFYSGVVVRYTDDFEAVVLGTYFA